jgi:hypothetical protein
MLPAVSSEDCLFADLGVDPGSSGCQSYEATDLLLRRRRVDPSAALLLWQVGALGARDYDFTASPSRLPVLVEYLRRWYPADHEVVAYEAAPYSGCGPLIERLRLEDLPDAAISRSATLYLAPAVPAEADPVMLERLGIAEPQSR